MAAPQRGHAGGRAIAPAVRLLYTDLPVSMLVIAGVCAAFSKYLESEGCQAAAAAAAKQPVYVPEGFPCGRPTLHQMAWLLGHPSAAFLLSPNPTHRCWTLVTVLLTQLIWLLSCILVSAASPSAPAGNDIRLRPAFYPLIRIIPKAMALAQLLAQGPIPTVIHIYTQSNQLLPVALLHVITSVGGHYTGLLDLPIFLASSLCGWLLTLATRYMMSMHGHATWTVRYVATDTFVYLCVPLLFTACMLGWERCSRHRRCRLHGEGSCGDVGGLGAAGQGGTGLGATAAAEMKAAAKVEGQGASIPSQCSADSSGEVYGAGHHQDQQDQQLPQRGQPSDGKEPVRNSSECGGRVSSSAAAAADEQEAVTAASRPSLASASMTPASGGGGGGGYHTAALLGPSLLAAAAAAVANNNRARGSNGAAVPFDDPEKWASVILVRQILAQPMAEWQSKLTRQRISIKVGPNSCLRISSVNSSR